LNLVVHLECSEWMRFTLLHSISSEERMQLESILMKLNELKAKIAEINAKLDEALAEIPDALDEVEISQDVEADLTAMANKAQALADLVPNVPPVEPPVEPALKY